MIERAAECLNHGGQSLLRGPKLHVRSRRSLHSTFWSHGAGAINLPTWWIALLQAQEPNDDPRQAHKKESAVDEAASGLQEVVLEFLYPAKTLALIRRIERSTTAHKRAAQNTRHRAREYTSYATALLTGSRNSSSVSGSDSGGVSVPQATSDAGAGKEKLRMRLDELLNAEDQRWIHDEVWQKHQDLLEASEPLSSQQLVRILQCLTSSKRPVDIERSIALFESIAVDQRRAIHYSHAINAALRLNDLITAVGIHNEALSRLRGHVGTSSIIRYAVVHNNWRAAIDMWRLFWDSKILYYTRPDIWDGIDALPLSDLIEKASSAIDYAVSMAESSEPNAAETARQFALELSKRSLKVQGVDFDISKHEQLLKKFKALGEDPNTQLSALAVGQLLSVESRQHGHRALHLYRRLRRASNFKPARKLLEDVLQRLYSIRSASGLLMMIEDWRRYIGKVTLRAYEMTMKRLAQAGEADALYKVFAELCADHDIQSFDKPQSAIWRYNSPVPQRRWPYHSLLHVHFRRADTERLVQTFEDLNLSHAFKPITESYNILIMAFSRVGDIDGTLEWFARLRGEDLKPNRMTFSSIMSMYAKRGDREAVLDWMQQSRAMDIIPDAGTIDQLVLCGVNEGQLNEAEKLVEDALHMDLEGSRTYMWNIVLNAYAIIKDMGKVSELRRRMQEAGVPFDSGTFAALITSLTIAKFPSSAWKLLDKTMPRLGIRRTAFHYALVMTGFFETKQYGQLFQVYQDMLSRKLSPNLSTQMSLLRAGASVDKQKSREEDPTAKTDFVLAGQILEQTLGNLDPKELAPTSPQRFVGPYSLYDAFISRYFEHMIVLYGRESAFDKVREVYERYFLTSGKFNPGKKNDSPPMNMISALLVSHKVAGNHEEVERCWYLALDKSEVLSRKAKSNTAEPDWALESRRFIINLPLRHYMSYLMDEDRLEDLIKVMNDVLRAGYDLDHGNWNRYIQYMSSSSKLEYKITAFEFCERHLIYNWPGWATIHRPNRMRYMFRLFAEKTRFEPTKRLPTYLTFVKLAAAYMELGYDQHTQSEVLPQVAPRTLDAIRDMPKVDDDEQRTFLRGEQ